MESVHEKYALPEAISADDFVFQKLIGEGTFATVFLAKNIHNNQQYAIKVLDRLQMRRNRITNYIDAEIEAFNILSGCTNHFVQMYGITHDFDFMYFVLGFAKNGDLFSYLGRKDYFNLAAARYYSAKLLLALEELHSRKIIHRDLKPENIMLDENWDIRIIDFGLAKILGNEAGKTKVDRKRTKGVIGTLQYTSPEVFDRSGAVYASDLWAYGCVVYQMVSGLRLFDGCSELTTFEMIQELDYDFPKDFDESAKDLVQKLLVLKPELRLGALDSTPYQSIRNHKFFSGIDWDNMGEPPKIAPDNKADCTESKVVYNSEPGFNYQILDKLYYSNNEEEDEEDEEEEEEGSSTFN